MALDLTRSRLDVSALNTASHAVPITSAIGTKHDDKTSHHWTPSRHPYSEFSMTNRKLSGWSWLGIREAGSMLFQRC